MKKFLFICLVLAMHVVVEILPTTPALPSLDNIQITADSMQYDPSAKTAEAQSNVRLVYTLNNMPVTLTADSMTAYFDESGKLVKVVAKGNVEVNYNEANLSAEICTHDFDKDQTVCNGKDVKITKHEDELHGTTATLDIKSQDFTMHATGRQVTGVIHPDNR